jgi:hypothetical protein
MTSSAKGGCSSGDDIIILKTIKHMNVSSTKKDECSSWWARVHIDKMNNMHERSFQK